MKRISIFTALALTLFAGQAYAETIRGTVSSVDPDGKSIQVSRVSENGSGSEEVKVSLKDDTRLSGVASAAELQPGQNVAIEAEQNFFTRAWSADSVDTNAAATEAPTSDATVNAAAPVDGSVATTTTTTAASTDADTAANAEVTGVDTRATATDPNASAGTTAPESMSEPALPAHDAATQSDTVYDAAPATSGSNVEPADAQTTVADDVHPAGTTAVESSSIAAENTGINNPDRAIDNSPAGLTESTSGGSNDTTTASNGADATPSTTASDAPTAAQAATV